MVCFYFWPGMCDNTFIPDAVADDDAAAAAAAHAAATVGAGGGKVANSFAALAVAGGAVQVPTQLLPQLAQHYAPGVVEAMMEEEPEHRRTCVALRCAALRYECCVRWYDLSDVNDGSMSA